MELLDTLLVIFLIYVMLSGLVFSIVIGLPVAEALSKIITKKLQKRFLKG